MTLRQSRARTQSLRMAFWMAGFALIYLAIAALLQQRAASEPLTLLLLLLPIVPLLGALWATLQHYRREPDELEQRIALLSITLTAGLLLILGTFWGFCVRFLDYPAFPLDLSLAAVAAVWPLMRALLWWRYR